MEIAHFPVEYKYVCDSGLQSRWEVGDNHTLLSDSAIVKDSWQLA